MILRTIIRPSDAFVVDGDIENTAVYSEYKDGDSGGGGRAKYDVFAPAHPQVVNQYVHEYNHNPRQDKQRPKYDYRQTLQQYKQAVARK